MPMLVSLHPAFLSLNMNKCRRITNYLETANLVESAIFVLIQKYATLIILIRNTKAEIQTSYPRELLTSDSIS